jgi:hypothetical protein
VRTVAEIAAWFEAHTELKLTEWQQQVVAEWIAIRSGEAVVSRLVISHPLQHGRLAAVVALRTWEVAHGCTCHETRRPPGSAALMLVEPDCPVHNWANTERNKQ